MADIIITTDGTAQLNIEQQPQPVLSIGAFCTGEKGADGRDGYTPVKGVDYFDGKDGKDGAPGKDGKSLTFDDLTEPQKAQLKGEKGDPGWIDCSTVFDQIFDNSAANNIGVKVRRINNTVYFIVKAAIKTLSEVVINIKNGGFSTGDTVSQILLLQQVRNAGKNSQIQATNYSFMWLPGYTGLKVGDTVIGNCSYLTSAAWPTALTF